MWYDILLYDYKYGWIPVNIKITSTTTADNIGNLATSVYSYTNYNIDLYNFANNGKMSRILCKKLQAKEYNFNYKKDYFFLVINKNNTCEVIINSVLGLNSIVKNLENIPYQVKWIDNKEYKFKNINRNIKMLLKALHKINKTWRDEFFENIMACNY